MTDYDVIVLGAEAPDEHFRRERGPFSATVKLSEVPKAATYTHAYADSNDFPATVSD